MLLWIYILFTTCKLEFSSLQRHIPWCMTQSFFQYLFPCKTKQVILQVTSCGHNGSGNNNCDKTKMKYLNVYYTTEMFSHILWLCIKHSNCVNFLTSSIVSSRPQSRYGLSGTRHSDVQQAISEVCGSCYRWQFILKTNTRKCENKLSVSYPFQHKVKMGVNPSWQFRSNGSKYLSSCFVKACFRHT